MKTRIIVAAAAALLVSLLLAAACGGDGGNGGNGGEAGIRTQKGLGVAALVDANRASQEGDGQGGADTGLAPGAPSADTGVASPDFAPFPFPSFQESQSGITVQGYGSATLTADSAILEFYFGGAATGIEPLPGRGDSEPGSSGGGVSPDAQPVGQAQQITEADLQPVVDAIIAQGVSPDDVEVLVSAYYGDPYGGSATIRVTARNISAVDGIVSAATQAASSLTDISLQATNVSYTVSDCAALEQAAMQAAVEDARDRGQNFASVLGVSLGSVVGASNYSSSVFGGSPCGSDFIGPYPLGGVAYAEGQAPDVQLYATVTITFAIQ